MNGPAEAIRAAGQPGPTRRKPKIVFDLGPPVLDRCLR
jgi:hypothetical protein